MSDARKRAQRLRTFDEEIARKIAEASASGELALAKDFGKPFAADLAKLRQLLNELELRINSKL